MASVLACLSPDDWRYIDIRTRKENNDGGCWLFLGPFDQSGYGRVGVRGRYYQVHRLNLERFSGPPPANDSQALHSCDTPRCVNPSHLRWGTIKENARDRAERNTQWREQAKEQAAKLHNYKAEYKNDTMASIDELLAIIHGAEKAS